MNNQFNSANVTNQHGIQMAQPVATSPAQASAAVLNTFLNAHQQQQQQFATAVSAGSIYTDPRHLHLNSNNIDKNYFTTTSATLGGLGTTQRFYTTAGSAAAGSGNSTVASSGVQHPNTILITNNFTHQQVAQPINSEQPRNLRIVTSGGNPLNSNTGSLATTGSDFQHSQHVFNINSNKHLQHLFPQHLLQQQNYQPATAPAELVQRHFTTQHYSSSQPNLSATPGLQMPQFYVSAESAVAPLNANPKILTNIPSHASTSATDNTVAPIISNSSNNTNPNNNSTVVLDRINICINNLYTDTSSSSSASNSLTSTPAQQPSPIIPAIQHKAVMENGIALPIATDIYESNVLIIDEPDSTTTATTPHTPPTTPENTPPTMPNNANNNNINNNIISTTSSFNSPSTSCNRQQLEKLNAITTTKPSFSLVAENIEKAAQDSTNAMDTSTDKISKSLSQEQNSQTAQNITSNSPLTPPTPPSPAVSNTDSNKNYQTENKEAVALPPPPLFSNGEDVFIKRHDGRFYLGTVIDTARNQFLVRFDDKTEVWCDAEEMRKLTGSTSNNTTSSADEKTSDQPMCVSCKRYQPDSKVEICERCGRGYHRKCTSETLPGSEVWLCKRCVKPMKLDDYSKFSSTEEETELETIHQLHYNIESLTWDAKHHMNMEQIYCYCGKTGKFDNNMLQCWRCLNWYHTYCIQKFIGNILRGDNFFVFCCSVCNGGGEYLRRLQVNWVEMAHLALYSLSTMKKHQKFYHLQKDINPFVLEKKKMFPIPKEWMSWPEKQFLDKIKLVLNDNPELFMCGKEFKRDHNLFALRIIEPPLVRKFNISQHDKLNDKFIFNVLKLQVLLNAPENADYKFQNTYLSNVDSAPKSKPKINEDSSSHDVYEFDDSSDDDIPVKRKIDKVKKHKLSPLTEAKSMRADKTKATPTKPISPLSATTLEKMDVEDDNANDAVINRIADMQSKKDNTMSTPRIEMAKKELTTIGPHKSASDNCKRKEESLNTTTKLEKSSRKRKAFTLSKSYKDMRLSDSSSDENSSSSSRGTSLDLIIPPPKNFFGQNNPFRIISPKKSSIDSNTASTSSGKKSVSFDIFNATRLNFSSKYAGLFPKLSTTNLAKAAGQPRTVRTIKRRLSAKDITIGPNKEVRRRRTRRLSSNIEIISTTTINPIPTNFFPIQAKDLLAAAAATTTTAASLFTTTQNKTSSMISSSSSPLSNVNSSTSCSPTTESTNMQNTTAQSVSTHGRRLRQRPQKNSPNTSRRSSISSNQSSNSSASAIAVGTTAQASNPSDPSHEDLKQTVNKYFGIVNRIESGEQFSIRAKRQLPNGQMQYLIEWGETQLSQSVTTPSHANALITNTTDQITTNNQPNEVSLT